MSVLKIESYPSDVLRKVAEPVKEIDDDIRRLVQDMIETMYHDDGVGLAAPQVGVSKRIMVVSPEAEPGTEQVYINLEIIHHEGAELGYEGCLSLPGVAAEVKRAQKIIFKALDISGNEIQVEAEDFFARVVQHEADHLEGKLLIDRVSFTERTDIIKQLNKQIMIG